MTETAELSIEEYRALLDEVFDDQVFGLTAETEASERFPRKLIEHLGERGVFAHKWRNGQHPAGSSARRCSNTGRCGCASPTCRPASTCFATGSTESPSKGVST
jgi:hypothetical protein